LRAGRSTTYDAPLVRRALAITIAIIAFTAAGASGATRPSAPRIVGPRATAPGPATFIFHARQVKKARFRCSLDRRRLHACPSRYRVVLTEGTHLLRAQAIAKGRRPSAIARVRIVVKMPLPPAGTVVARISVFNPHDVAFAGGSAWVPMHHGGALARIDPATNTVATSLPVTDDPSVEQPGRLGYGDGVLWLTNYTNEGIPGSLVRIDPATGQVVAVVRTPDSLCCTPIVGGGSVWAIAPDLAGGTLLKISELTNTIVGTAQVAHLFPLVGAYAAGSLWINSGGDVLRLDPETSAVTARIGTGGTNAFVVGYGAGTVWVDLGREIARVDPSTNAITARIELPETLPEEGHLVAVEGNRAWITGSSVGKPALWRVDVPTNAVTGVVRLATRESEVSGVAVGAGAVWASLYERNEVVRVAPS
jgi:virginiamycin B lyase